MWFLCDKSFLVLGTQVNDSLPSNTVCDIVELRSQYTMVTCISFVQWNASNVNTVETTTSNTTHCWAKVTVHHGSMHTYCSYSGTQLVRWPACSVANLFGGQLVRWLACSVANLFGGQLVRWLNILYPCQCIHVQIDVIVGHTTKQETRLYWLPHAQHCITTVDW